MAPTWDPVQQRKLGETRPAASPTSSLGGPRRGEKGEVLLDGRLVWREAETRDETQVGLGTLLSAIGASDQQAAYIESVLHPLIAAMVLEAVRAVPGDPAAFCVLWLLSYLGAPGYASGPVRAWLEACRARKEAPSNSQTSILPVESIINSGIGHGGDEVPLHSDEDRSVCMSRAHSTASTRRSVVFGQEEEVAEDMARYVSARGSVSSASERDESPSRSQESGSRHGGASSSTNSPRRPRKVSSSADLVITREKAWERRRSVAPSFNRPADAQIVEYLNQVPVIRENLSEEEILAVASAAQVRNYDPDAVIVNHGETMTEAFLLHEGRCTRSVPQVVGNMQAGDLFGERALLKGPIASTQTISVAHDGHAVVLSLNFADLEQLGVLHKIRAVKRRSKSRCIGRGLEIDLDKATASTTASAPTTPQGMSVGLQRRASKDRRMYDSQGRLDPSDKKLITEAVRNNQNIMELIELSEEHLDEIAKCAVRCEVDVGKALVIRGEMGNAFYVIEEGMFEVVKDPDPNDPCKNVDGVATSKLRIGDSFGELSLLYDSPVDHTVVASSKSSVWLIELQQWRQVFKHRTTNRLRNYVTIIEQIEELSKEVSGHLSELAEALEEIYLLSGEVLTTRGDAGDTMYILFEGACKVLEDGSSGTTVTKQGSYFGIEALLREEPYQSTIVVKSEKATVLALDRVTLDLVAHGEFGLGKQTSESVAARLRQRRHRTHKQSCELDAIPFDRLRRVGILGTGSFSTVTLEEDESTHQLYAMKRMAKKALVGIEDKVISEKNAMLQMSSDFVVSLVRTYQDKSSVYFLMRPALGGELFELYTTKTGLFGSQKHAAFYTVCIALGLDHMHGKKIIHRDIKLENILLDSRGYAQITDLGLAKTVVGKTYTVCGTADYFAPETLRQVGHNRAVDWWALGIMVFVMMAGRTPFDADEVMQTYRSIVKGFKKEHFPDSFPANVVDIIKSLCKKKPEDRIAMLPGGARNLREHPWLQRLTDWDAIQQRTHEAPYQPEAWTLEELRERLRQQHDVVFESCDEDAQQEDGERFEGF
eukprot:TRINITY_DN39597_c0_g1_i1.p1 TRINITY_DN39597_c0_g1~~TRINITY_DN39597_c0_g1_i1.p1  ORF type:complete len:1052 (-),score=172.76 TRINITY_DN39597_c0_g1_i1:53-3208(-)